MMPHAPSWLSEICALGHQRLILPGTKWTMGDAYVLVNAGDLEVSEEPPYVVARILEDNAPADEWIATEQGIARAVQPSAREIAMDAKRVRETEAKRLDAQTFEALQLGGKTDEELQALYDALPGERCTRGRYKGMILSTGENEIPLRVICAEINKRHKARQIEAKLQFNKDAVAYGFRLRQRVSSVVPSLLGASRIEGTIIMRGGVMTVKVDGAANANRKYAQLHKGWNVL